MKIYKTYHGVGVMITQTLITLILLIVHKFLTGTLEKHTHSARGFKKTELQCSKSVCNRRSASEINNNKVIVFDRSARRKQESLITAPIRRLILSKYLCYTSNFAVLALFTILHYIHFYLFYILLHKPNILLN